MAMYLSREPAYHGSRSGIRSKAVGLEISGTGTCFVFSSSSSLLRSSSCLRRSDIVASRSLIVSSLPSMSSLILSIVKSFSFFRASASIFACSAAAFMASTCWSRARLFLRASALAASSSALRRSILAKNSALPASISACTLCMSFFDSLRTRHSSSSFACSLAGRSLSSLEPHGLDGRFLSFGDRPHVPPISEKNRVAPGLFCLGVSTDGASASFAGIWMGGTCTGAGTCTPCGRSPTALGPSNCPCRVTLLNRFGESGSPHSTSPITKPCRAS